MTAPRCAIGNTEGLSLAMLFMGKEGQANFKKFHFGIFLRLPIQDH